MLNTIVTEIFPIIDGLTVEPINLDSDLEELIQMLNLNARVNHLEDYYGIEEMRNYFDHCNNFDIKDDLILVKIDQKIVGYQRITWREITLENKIIYQMMGTTHPDWLGLGIGSAMMAWGENRLREISQTHDDSKMKVFQAYTNDNVESRVSFLKNNGFSPARYFYLMERKNLDKIPFPQIPEGVSLRAPKGEADWRKAFDCLNDAFKDHWGYSEISEKEIQGFLNNPYMNAELTQLAWKDERVIGTVIVFIDSEENKNLNKSRAWTEEITVRKEYRGQGIAKAMIYSAMHAVKQAGFKTTALGVDTNNPNGALALYQKCGYEQISTSVNYEKPL